MIAELLARELSSARWGPKAARLSQAALHGVPVPQGLCLDSAAGPAALDQHRPALAHWLTATRPPAVIVRSSATAEDGAEVSAAGRFLTVRDVRPHLADVLDALQRVSTSQERAGGGCVIVQQQLHAELMGVTFSRPDGSLLTEGSPAAAAVTDGAAPAFTMNSTRESFSLHGELTTVPPVLLALYLDRLVRRLAEIFPFPLDLEWATVAGQVFLLQVRPVTASIEPAA
ncbi:hypothetical protein [Streptomyces sp. CA-111067]|uniref:hypothetical protein n=1 Tax=Streptomyces sp. CA-111067 TaxID=3240046 RepID=UPI003D987683